jgi:hypothetical protein
MAMDDRAARHDAAQHSAEQAPRPIGADEVWRLVAPGLGYVFLAAAAVLGLFTASGAGDDATYAAGIATFLLAAIIIAARMKRQFDGREVGFLLDFSVANSDSLFVSIVVLTVLALAGLVLAAAVGGTLNGIGLALFVIATAVIFRDIKRYFDRREGSG